MPKKQMSKRTVKRVVISKKAVRIIPKKILRSPTLSVAEIFAEETKLDPTFNEQIDFRRIPSGVDAQLHELIKEFRLDRLA